MASCHRLEVLQHGADDRFESWTSPDGRVALMRKQGETLWKAVVDRVPVVDAERLNGAMERHAPLEHQAPTAQDAVMMAASAHGLAAKLSLQEHLHIIFDAATD